MTTPNWPHKRPAPKKAAGSPANITDDVHWTRNIEPRERYRIVYVDRNGERSERTIDLVKMGDSQGIPYVGVFEAGRFKTYRQDRIIDVLEQFTTGHEPSISAQPTYATQLPQFPDGYAVYRVPSIAGNRSWSVDLNQYICTCPEKRIRESMGYLPGTLGHVCPHMARAILEHLPENSGWAPELLTFLRDPRKMHIDNLR